MSCSVSERRRRAKVKNRENRQYFDEIIDGSAKIVTCRLQNWLSVFGQVTNSGGATDRECRVTAFVGGDPAVIYGAGVWVRCRSSRAVVRASSVLATTCAARARLASSLTLACSSPACPR